MNKLLLLFSLLFLFSCSEEEFSNLHTFKNNTEYNITIFPHEINQESTDSPYFELAVAPGEEKTYRTNEFYGIFDVKSSETEKVFGIDFNSQGVNVITAFNYKVRYSITGNASSADVTYGTSSGGTRQYTVNIPSNISFREFNDDFKYISAQNNQEHGGVTVEIFYEDISIAYDGCSGAYCIAMASN
ncbi:hypothetical protein RM545_06465 [Zunongwangia sp. F260]|uniref:Lipoprotein n=1 Tax=Autumnicola lenta TaxID=3075593 RepID=A0ABU3CIZ9_9FLAO|nr:hypothetical protein [Zunongwangia sp. F260]MDT0646328.1 hypothetical protein [Zunongwangia sp. F260]